MKIERYYDEPSYGEEVGWDLIPRPTSFKTITSDYDYKNVEFTKKYIIFKDSETCFDIRIRASIRNLKRVREFLENRENLQK